MHHFGRRGADTVDLPENAASDENVIQGRGGQRGWIDDDPALMVGMAFWKRFRTTVVVGHQLRDGAGCMRVSALSARLVERWARAPRTIPAINASGEVFELLYPMLPDSRSARQVSAWPATADLIPWCLAATRTHGIVENQGPSDAALDLTTVCHLAQRGRIEVLTDLGSTVSTADRMATLARAHADDVASSMAFWMMS